MMLALLTDLAINRTKFGRGIRAVAQDPRHRGADGRQPGPRHHADLPARRPDGRRGGAAVHLKVPQGIIYSGGFLLGIKAFSAAVLGGIGNLRGALLGGPAARRHGELRAGGVRHPVARRRRVRAARPGAAVPSDRDPRASRWEGHGHELDAGRDRVRRRQAPGDALRLVGRPVAGAEVGVRRGGLRSCWPCWPLLSAAIPRHPEHQLRRHHGAVRDGRHHRDRPQRRGRPGRPARPRLRRLLRRRRLHRRAADQPRQPAEQGRPDRFFSAWAWLSCVPLAMAFTAWPA